MTQPCVAFETAARTLLDPEAIPLDALEAARTLHSLCVELVGAPARDEEAQAGPWRQPTHLPTGKAIDPESAGRCVLDYARTRAFAWGVRDGIRATLARVEERPLRVVYAGTGPFAILALLQAPWFSPREVRFTCLDIHPTSLASVETLAEQLGFRDHLDGLLEVDATTWVPDRPVHGLIVEVMLKALHKEPQVAVTRNLTRYLHDDGFLVPESVELDLALLDPGAELQALVDAEAPRPPDRIPLGCVLRLDRHAHAAPADPLWPTTIQLPPSRPSGHELHVLTRIAPGPGHQLRERESGLTYSTEVDVDLRPEGTLQVHYEISGEPGLRVRPD